MDADDPGFLFCFVLHVSAFKVHLIAEPQFGLILFFTPECVHSIFGQSLVLKRLAVLCVCAQWVCRGVNSLVASWAPSVTECLAQMKTCFPSVRVRLGEHLSCAFNWLCVRIGGCVCLKGICSAQWGQSGGCLLLLSCHTHRCTTNNFFSGLFSCII